MSLLLVTLFVPSLAFTAGGEGSGGGSTGGGDFFTPSEKQVVDSVSPASLMIMSALTDFWPNYDTGKQEFGKLIPKNLDFLALDGDPKYFGAITQISLASSENKPKDLSQFFYFKHKGLCPGPDGKSHAGSVSFPNGKAQLCIALEKMTSIPRDYLTEEMAILLAHEATHLAGRNEADANATQEWFSNYNKVRLDIGRFTFGKEHSPSQASDFRMMALVLSKFSNPNDKAKICSNINSSIGYELDRDVKAFKNNTHLEYFKINFPSPDNDYRYWGNRAAAISKLACADENNWDQVHAATSALETDFEAFMQQFGRAVPRELIP